jgi:hypothetical protein
VYIYKKAGVFSQTAVPAILLKAMTMNKSINKFIINTILLILSNSSAFGQPKIKFDSLDYTMKPVKKYETAELKIPFKNIGNEPLIITNAQGSGTPYVTGPKEPVLPTGTGFIEFRIPANFAGTTVQRISINTNIDEKSIVLTIKLQIIEVTLMGDKVFGKVTGEDGLPLPGVSVAVEGTNRGTTSDTDGNYSVRAKQDQILVFSSAGMISQRINVTGNEMDVKLQERHDMPKDEAPYPYYRHIQREEGRGSIITVRDLKKSGNPKYNFKKNAGNNLFIIFISDTANLNNLDLEFQKKYKIIYSLSGNYGSKYLMTYNKFTFKYLIRKYKRDWLIESRKDAIGLDAFVK